MRATLLWLGTGTVVGAFVIPPPPPLVGTCVDWQWVNPARGWCSLSPRRVAAGMGVGGDVSPMGRSSQTENVESGSPSNNVFDALIDQFLTPKNGNLTATVEEYLDMCDYALLLHLNDKIERVGPQSDEGLALKLVGGEINQAMQRRLVAADTNLREILSLAPDIKKMEGKVRSLFLAGKLDMAFMVMINMNLQQAKEAEGAGNAVMLLTHLTTFIMTLQDERLTPEVKLLRVLIRTDCEGVRRSMLQDQLELPSQELDLMLESLPNKNKVQPQLLLKSISDMRREAEELGQAIDHALCETLGGLKQEVETVVGEASQRPGPFK